MHRMGDDVKQKTVKGMIWKFLENGGTQGIQFITSVVLARLLDPTDYSVLTIIVIFVSLATVFASRGFSNALVQNRESGELEYSTVFYFLVAMAVLSYAVLYIAAPFIARAYAEPLVTPSLRTISLMLFANAFITVQEARVMRDMAFRKMFAAGLTAVLVSGVIGITMAYLGYGVWALVAQQISSRFVLAILLMLLMPWRPQWAFSFSGLKKLFSYSWKLMTAGLLTTLYDDISSLIIGKKYLPETMAYYRKAKQFPDTIAACLYGASQTALFSTFSSQQDDGDRLRTMLRRSNAGNAFLTFPIMVGLAVTARPMISLLLTDKWLPSVPYLQIMCVMYAFLTVDEVNLQIVKAVGRSDSCLYLEVAKKAVGVLLLAVALTLFQTPFAIAICVALTSVFGVLINMPVLKKLVGYQIRQQISDLLPPLVLSLVMGACVYAVTLLPLSNAAMLLTQIVLGVAIYVGLSLLFRVDTFFFLLRSLKELKNKQNAESENLEDTKQ